MSKHFTQLNLSEHEVPEDFDPGPDYAELGRKAKRKAVILAAATALSPTPGFLVPATLGSGDIPPHQDIAQVPKHMDSPDTLGAVGLRHSNTLPKNTHVGKLTAARAQNKMADIIPSRSSGRQ